MRFSLAAASSLLLIAPASAADLGSYPEPTPYAEAASPHIGPSGVFDIMGGYGQLSNDDDSDLDESYWEIRGSGRVNLPFADMASAQFDIIGAYGEGYDDSSSAGNHEAWGAGAHISLRDNQTYLFGLFGGYQTANYIDTTSESDGLWLAGAEAQGHWGPFTLYGQGGYADTVNSDNSGWQDIIFVRGVARYFATPDTKLEGEVGYGWGHVESDDDAPLLFWAASLQQQIPGTPLSGFIRYEGSILKNDAEGDKLTDHAIFGGLSLAFGGSTLEDQNRAGATLDMPNFLRTIAVSNQFD